MDWTKQELHKEIFLNCQLTWELRRIEGDICLGRYSFWWDLAGIWVCPSAGGIFVWLVHLLGAEWCPSAPEGRCSRAWGEGAASRMSAFIITIWKVKWLSSHPNVVRRTVEGGETDLHGLAWLALSWGFSLTYLGVLSIYLIFSHYVTNQGGLARSRTSHTLT